MSLTVLVPTTVELPATSPEGTRYLPYDVSEPLDPELLDAEVLVVWGNPDPMLADAARKLRGLRFVQRVRLAGHVAI